MKIVYLSNSILPSRSANSIHVMKMGQAFSENGHETTLLGIYHPQIKNNEKLYDYYNVTNSFDVIRTKRLPLKGISTIKYAFDNRKKVKNFKDRPDLLYARDMYSLFVSSKLGIPFIFEAHSIPLNYVQYKIQKLLFKNNNFLKLVVISSALKNEYLKIFPFIQPNKILVAHDGADENKQKDHVKLLSEQKDKLKVGYIGHLYKGRGIELIEKMSVHCQWAEFHLIGGTSEDIEYWKKRLKNKSNVFIYGYVPYSLTDSYRNQFDVLIAPYQNKVAVYGGKGDTSKWMSPLKIFEYMAAGKPIVCSDLPVIREVLETEYNAILCDIDDISSWINSLKRLYENKELRERLGNNAKRDFKKNYTWRARAKNILKSINFF